MGTLKKNNVMCLNPFCCGNERHIRGTNRLTRQELKAEIDKHEQFYNQMH